MKYFLALVVLFLAINGCKTKSLTVSRLKCETDSLGNLKCDVAGGPAQTFWCRYAVDNMTGSDCNSVGINLGDIVCVICSSGQNACPPTQVMTVAGTNCRLRVRPQGSNCLTCPQGGIPVKVAD